MSFSGMTTRKRAWSREEADPCRTKQAKTKDKINACQRSDDNLRSLPLKLVCLGFKVEVTGKWSTARAAL